MLRLVPIRMPLVVGKISKEVNIIGAWRRCLVRTFAAAQTGTLLGRELCRCGQGGERNAPHWRNRRQYFRVDLLWLSSSSPPRSPGSPGQFREKALTVTRTLKVVELLPSLSPPWRYSRIPLNVPHAC